MTRRNPMKLPTSQRFWRGWLRDPTEFNTLMDDDALAHRLHLSCRSRCKP